MLNAVDENLWVVPQPLRFFGADVGCRMTCIRLSGGELVVHSPVRATPELQDAVAELGPVGWLVAPNAFHHLFFQQWRERFPDAQPLVAPKLRRKRRDLAGVPALGEAPAAWQDELETVAIGGLPAVDETVFFHRPSATLILTDLAFHFTRESPLLTRGLIRVVGRLGELSPTLLERLLIRDRKAFRASLERVFAWPFDRVVVSHGEIVESGGRAALARGFDWLGGVGERGTSAGEEGTRRPPPPR